MRQPPFKKKTTSFFTLLIAAAVTYPCRSWLLSVIQCEIQTQSIVLLLRTVLTVNRVHVRCTRVPFASHLTAIGVMMPKKEVWLELSRKYRLLPLSKINSPFPPRSSTCRCSQGMCLVEPCRDYDLPSVVSWIRLARVLWTVIMTPTSQLFSPRHTV
jgi:hypothetical protein